MRRGRAAAPPSRCAACAGTPGVAICVTLAGALAAIAFVGNGGLQLGSSTLVEVGGDPRGRAAGRGRARLRRGRRAALRRHGAGRRWRRSPRSPRCRSSGRCIRPTRGSRPTARLPTWPRSPAGSRPCGCSRAAGSAVLYGVLIALAVVCLYGLATKVAPGLAGRGRDLRAAARALRLLERGRRHGGDGHPALPVARHARGTGAVEGARLSAPRHPDRDDAAELLARQHHRRGRRHRPVAGARAAAAARRSPCCCRRSRARRS